MTSPTIGPSASFVLRLDNFEGPFDLLLQLINRRQLDITHVALSQVTDEFIAHVKAGGQVWDLDQTSGFLLVAATLLDLKAARLLPGTDVEDPEDLAVLEARDLLFARLMQYRAFKQASGWFAAAMEDARLVRGRPGGLEPQFKGLLPKVVIPGGAQRLHKVAVKVFTVAEPPTMPLEQLHLPQVSVAQQAQRVAAVLRVRGRATFVELVRGVDRLTTVARFLALLEMYRNHQVGFEQETPLGTLEVIWTGGDAVVEISDEFDGNEQQETDDD